jgi:hypothetical protein
MTDLHKILQVLGPLYKKRKRKRKKEKILPHIEPA